MAESKIPLMEDDVEIIKKLGNKPGSENKLQTPELKSKFDEGSVLLKAHLNKVIGILNTLLGSAGGLLDGGNMMGALNMNGYRLFGISNPTDWNHAANKGYVDSKLKFGGASMANSIVMEYDLGTSFTAEQSADIRAGKFEKVHVGGYWTINGRKYWAAHADYRLHCGDTELTTHHMLVIPDKSLFNMAWNDTSTTAGGYVGSKVKTEGMAQALEIIKSDFGADHILPHRVLLTNAVASGMSSGLAWYDSQIDLMNEKMVYGSSAWGGGAQNGHDTGADKSQLALFQARPDMITNREIWWLRDVRSATDSCRVDDSGTANRFNASYSFGVRPAFLVY